MSADERKKNAIEDLDRIASDIETRFQAGRRVLSFRQYLELFAEEPVRQGRDAATYTRDMFDYYGTSYVDRPWGKSKRYRLFDLPWDLKGESRDVELVAHEELQDALYRSLSNFVNEGRPN